MRIISGNLKGKKNFSSQRQKNKAFERLSKGSIFNLIEHSNKFNCKLKNSNVLDLFSGTGSFGIECISRDVKKVTFIEYYKNALIILMKNIQNLEINKKTVVIKANCFDFFNSKKNSLEKFDIIFMDPPFKEKKINLIITDIVKNNVLNKNGILIIHRHIKDDIHITENLKIIDERNYGISKIIFGN